MPVVDARATAPAVFDGDRFGFPLAIALKKLGASWEQ